jgi:membrane fusion protein (multidrug efflux system)
VAVDASSTAAGLLGGETTCDKSVDTAAYWHPTLYDHDEVVVPRKKPPYLVMGIVGVAFVVGGVVGLRWWQHQAAFVSTEDAQVAGDIVTVSPRVAGRLAELKVDEGQSVKKGQVVAKLDDTDYAAQLAQAQAALSVAQSNVPSAQAGVSLQAETTNAQVAQAQAGVSAALGTLDTAIANQAKAEADLARYRTIYAEGGLSRQAYEAAVTASRSAAAAVSSARAQVSSARQAVALAGTGHQAVQIKQGAVASSQAQVKQAQAAARTAALQLSHTTITAPADGLIVRRTMNAGEQVAPGQAVFSLVKTDKLWINAYVEETQIRRVRVGEPVEVHIDAFPKETFKGRVSFVNAVTGAQFSLMPANNASGNFTKTVQRIPVKIAVEDPQHRLAPGMSAVIDIEAR